MRRGNEPAFLHHEGTLLGVSLGADFTAEHEMGIKSMKQDLGIPTDDKVWGLKRRQITRLPDPKFHSFGWTTGYVPKSEGFYFLNSWNEAPPNFSRNSELSIYRGTLAGAWDDREFGVFSSNPAEIANLKEIYESFLKLDGAVFLGGGSGWMGTSGLVLAIASRIPDQFTQAWYDADKAAYEIEQVVVKSGIRELLAKTNKRYFALSRPRYENGVLTFWLNPMEQRSNNSGWFTIDNLKDWAKGKGPIPK